MTRLWILVLTLALLTGSAYGSVTFWMSLLGIPPAPIVMPAPPQQAPQSIIVTGFGNGGGGQGRGGGGQGRGGGGQGGGFGGFGGFGDGDGGCSPPPCSHSI